MLRWNLLFFFFYKWWKAMRQASHPSRCNTGSGSGLEWWHKCRRTGKPRAGLYKFIQLGTKCLEQGFICQQLYTITCGFEARVIGMLWAFASAFGICLKTTWKEGRFCMGLSQEPSPGSIISGDINEQTSSRSHGHGADAAHQHSYQAPVSGKKSPC